jgi:hypothetical protein
MAAPSPQDRLAPTEYEGIGALPDQADEEPPELATASEFARLLLEE